MLENNTRQGQDFLVSELLSEQKAENERKSHTISFLIKVVVATIVGALLAVLLTNFAYLLYLNQYDFSGTSTSTTTTTNTADGVYAIVDSDGNVITSDLTPEQLQALIEKGLVIDGNSNQNINNNRDNFQKED